jgi:hypothetical protein
MTDFTPTAEFHRDDRVLLGYDNAEGLLAILGEGGLRVAGGIEWFSGNVRLGGIGQLRKTGGKVGKWRNL